MARPKLLSEQCATCIYRPGNLMSLKPGALKDITDANIRGGAPLICHDTLKFDLDGEWIEDHPDNAVCRGFYDRYGPATQLVRIIERLGGYEIVDPPGPIVRPAGDC